MPKVSPTQNNFTAGELSPWLYGRFDIAKYSNAAKTLENILIHQAGGGQRRPGTKYVTEVENSDEKTRLVTFEFSTTQAYILEFGDQYIRFYRNRGQIVYETLTIDDAPVGGDFAAAETLTGADSGESCIVVAKTSSTVYTIKHRTGTFTDGEVIASNGKSRDCGAGFPTVADSVTPAELATSYLTADLFDLQFAQDADTMWIVHPSYKPQKLTRTAHDDWSIGNYAPAGDDFDAANKYPSCVAMFEQRIWFANTNTLPQTIWGSESGDFEVMTPGVNAGDPFLYAIASDKVNAIRWLKPGPKSLLLGTIGATFSLSSGAEAVAVTPTNVSVKRDTTYGAANILPETIGNFIYYVGRDLNHLRELGFSFDIEAQQALDMTILSDHIAKAADPLDTDGFTQIAYQQSPVSRLWCVRNDGQLAVLTRQIDQEVIGWSRQIAGADLRARGEFESVAIVPTDEGDDEVWVIVKRYINSSVVRYVEYFMPEKFDHQQDAFFVDSGLSLDSPKTITNIKTKETIDDMEYPSDAAAQAAYVTSDADQEVIDQSQTARGRNDAVLGQLGPTNRYRPAQSFQLSDDLTVTAVEVYRRNMTGGTPTGNWTLRIETDNGGFPSGTLANVNASIVVAPPAVDNSVKGTFETSFILSGSTLYHLVVECDNQASEYWVLGQATEELYADGHASRSTNDVWASIPYDLWFKVYALQTVLQCYSESTIVQQGAYSLRALAQITDSLNDTLTRTPSTAIDLTGVDSIKMSVRASRIGSNFKIGFHDAGGVTTEHTVNIAVADTWQTETIDISGVADGNKDGIDSIIITILDADATNTFYIDNIYGVLAYITVTAASHGFVDDDEIKIVDVVGMTEVNNERFFVDKLAGTDSFALKDSAGSYIDGSDYVAYITGGEARKMVTEIEGLTHLVREEVTITADGAAVTTKIVNSDGEITLDAKASIAHVGLPYISNIGLLPMPEGSATGTAIGKVQRIYKLIIKLYRSLGFQFGPDEDNLDAEEITELFTGDRIPEFHGDWDRTGKVLLRQAQPLPLNILSVTIISEVVDD